MVVLGEPLGGPHWGTPLHDRTRDHACYTYLVFPTKVWSLDLRRLYSLPRYTRLIFPLWYSRHGIATRYDLNNTLISVCRKWHALIIRYFLSETVYAHLGMLFLLCPPFYFPFISPLVCPYAKITSFAPSSHTPFGTAVR
jgi:hypothetical protein